VSSPPLCTVPANTLKSSPGKTHTLVHRIVYLVENGVSPRRTLAVMSNRTPAADFAAHLAPRMTRLAPLRTRVPCTD
jgi:superfamily I DNA/RNA helicase